MENQHERRRSIPVLPATAGTTCRAFLPPKGFLTALLKIGKELVRKRFARASGIEVEGAAGQTNLDDADQSRCPRGRPGRLSGPSFLMLLPYYRVKAW
jgi:hypothetical protein